MGLGDAAPWTGFGGGAEATHECLQKLVDNPRFIQGPELPFPGPPEAAFALETAWFDLRAQAEGVPLRNLLATSPEPPRDHLPIRALVHTPEDARAAVDAGHSHLKTKVAGDHLASDVGRILAIRRAAGESAQITLDANGGWTRAQTLEAFEALSPARVGWFEQPLPASDLEGHAHLRSRGVPIAIDEGIESLADLERYHGAGAVDRVVIKPMFAGGLRAAAEIARRAAELGLESVYTTALESPVGRLATAQLAAAAPATTNTLGWGPSAVHPEWLGEVPIQGTIHLPTRPGIGVARRPLDPHALPNPVASAARSEPGNIALITPTESLTWREMRGRVEAQAAVLQAAGVQPGSLVAIHGPSNSDWVVAYHAIGWLGAIAGLLPPVEGTDLRDALLRLDPDVVVETGPEVTPAGPWNVSRLNVDAPESLVEERLWPLSELRVVLESSGTTGTPHQVALTTGQITFNAMGATLRLGHLAEDRWIACMPLHHVGGVSILIRCAMNATTTRLEVPFDAERVAELLDGGEAEQISLVPTMLEKVLNAREERPFPATLRGVLLGGAAASEALLERCEALGVPLRQSWGMSETAAQICTMASRNTWTTGDAGPAHAFARVQTEGDHLIVTGPTAPGGRFTTPDRGSIDDRDIVRIEGRHDDIVNSGGELIDPTRVEEGLARHVGVAEAIAFGLPDERWGQRLVALLVGNGERPASDELREWSRTNLGPIHAPHEFRWVEAIPRTALGKKARERAKAIWSEAS